METSLLEYGIINPWFGFVWDYASFVMLIFTSPKYLSNLKSEKHWSFSLFFGIANLGSHGNLEGL